MRKDIQDAFERLAAEDDKCATAYFDKKKQHEAELKTFQAQWDTISNSLIKNNLSELILNIFKPHGWDATIKNGQIGNALQFILFKDDLKVQGPAARPCVTFAPNVQDLKIAVSADTSLGHVEYGGFSAGEFTEAKIQEILLDVFGKSCQARALVFNAPDPPAEFNPEVTP